MIQRLILFIGLIVTIQSCSKSDETEAPIVYETLIDFESEIDEIILEGDYFNIRSFQENIKCSTSGELIETRQIENTNYGYFEAFKLVKGGYIKIERNPGNYNMSEPAYFMIHQYSNDSSAPIRTDTLRTDNSDLMRIGHIVLSNNYDLPNENKIGAYVDFNDQPYWTKHSVELFGGKKTESIQRIKAYTLDDKLVRYFHHNNLLYAYKDVFISFGNFNFSGDNFTKDMYIIYPDGTYKLAHSKENEDEEMEIFHHNNKLYANYKSDDKCRVLSTTNLEDWNANHLSFSFDYLGEINSHLVGKVYDKIVKLDLNTNEFMILDTKIDLSDCQKIIEDDEYTYFIKTRQIFKLKTNEITFVDSE